MQVLSLGTPSTQMMYSLGSLATGNRGNGKNLWARGESSSLLGHLEKILKESKEVEGDMSPEVSEGGGGVAAGVLHQEVGPVAGVDAVIIRQAQLAVNLEQESRLKST